VSVTHIQEEIHKKCKPELMITLLRRFMFRIAERHALHIGAQCLITGESLGQVASQTIEGMTSSNSVVETLPVLRPLVGFDKNEIIDRSVKIGTYETSILPYEDCCTVFLPDFPATRPKLKDILAEEKKLDVEELIKTAFESMEKIEL
jgi:thiamine biosynthesis protein ThiI